MKKLIKRIRSHKNSILSFLFALLLMFTFNYSTISVLSNYLDVTSAYKSDIKSSYYSTANENYISDASMPDDMKDYLSSFFEGSSRQFNILDYYNEKFDEELTSLSNEFFEEVEKTYGETSVGINTYPYKEFLEHYGVSNLREYYNQNSDWRSKYDTFQSFLEYFIMMKEELTFTEGDVRYSISHLPAPYYMDGDTKYKTLQAFYNALYNKFSGKDPVENEENDRNDGADSQFSDDQDYYFNSKSYTDRFKKMVNDRIKEYSVVYGYDGVTQSRTVAGIVAKDAPVSSYYYYSRDTFDTTTKARYQFEKINYQSNYVEKIYFFGESSELTSGLSQEQVKTVNDYISQNRLVFANRSDLQNYPFYYHKIENESEGLYFSGKETYLKYVSTTNGSNAIVPYEYTLINNNEYYNVYVELDDSEKKDFNNQATIDTLKFRDAYNTITSTELSQNKEWYVQVPYFGNNTSDANLINEEFYFAFLFNLIGYKNQDGSYFKNYCELFTKVGAGGKRVSRIYLKLTPTSTRNVFIVAEDTSAEALETLKESLSKNDDTKNYAYLDNIHLITADQAQTDEFVAVSNSSTESAYILKGYEDKIYFKKTRVYFSKFLQDETERYGEEPEYESKYVADIKYEQNTNVVTAEFEKDANQYKIYILNDGTLGTTQEIDGKVYDVLDSAKLTGSRNVYVKVPVSVKTVLNTKAGNKNYEYYYKHVTKTENQIYVYTEEENAEDNEVYKNLNYKVLTKTEYDSHKSYYCVIPSTDSNYNANLKLYYKYAFSAENANTSEIFVQNKISNGNAVFIVDDTVNPSEFDIYNELNYTVITSEELKLNADFYVLMPDNEDTKYTTLYYKYLPKQDVSGNYLTERIVYLYSNRTSTTYKTFYNTDNDYYAGDYELVTPDHENDYVEGTNLYYKKIVKNSNTDKIDESNYTEKAEDKKVYYYYSTSYTTTLSANSYYAIAFYVYTTKDVQASFYLYDSNDIIDASAEHINTNGTWQKHYLFVATDSINQSVISLRMYMGDKDSIKGSLELEEKNTVTGMVLFDNIQIIQINETDYNKKAIDDATVEADKSKKSEETTEPSEAAEEPVTPENYKDEYGNLVIVNNNNGTNRDNFDYRTKSTVSVYTGESPLEGSAAWDNMFDFDSSTALQTLINESLSLDASATGYTQYSSLWQYYISRTASDLTLTLNQYRSAYTNHDLDIAIIDEADDEVYDSKVKDREEQIKEAEKDKEDEEEDNTSEEEEDDNVYYIKDTFKNNNKILKLHNNNKSISLGIVSNFFVIPQNEYYKITLWIYSPEKNASATISVFSVMQTEKAPSTGAENENRGYQAITSAEISANIRNYDSSQSSEYGWIPVSYYIEGNALQDSKCYLALEANKNDTVYFDNISIQRVTSSEYDSASSDRLTTTQTLSLTSSNSLITSGITNGNFYNITDTNYKDANDFTKPYTAESWTIQTDSSSNVVAGVVLTSSSYVNSEKEDFANFYNKYSDKGAKAVLESEYIKNMNLYGIYAPKTIDNPLLESPSEPDTEGSKIGITNKYRIYSNSISLSSNSVYRITFNFYATTSFEGNLVSNLYYSSVSASNILSSYSVKYGTDESNQGSWHTYTYYVATGMSSISVYLELGISNATGVCYFQNADSATVTGKINDLKNNLLSATEGKTEIKELDDCRFVDFSTTNFSIYEQGQDEFSGLHNSKDYSSSVNSTSNATIGKTGVAVASYYTTTETVTYTATINDVTYYLYDVDKDGTFELYSEDPSKAEDLSKLEPVTEIGGETVTVVSNLQVIVGEDNKTAVTKNVTNNYDYKFDGNNFYKDELTGKEFVVVGDMFIPVEELNNNHSKNTLILANSLTTDYSVMSPVYSNSLSSSAFYAVKIYIKTGGFESSYDDFGLTVTVSGISSSFPVIDTTKVDDSKKTDGFVCYQVLISTNTSSISQLAVEFSLGTEKKTGKGYAIIAGVEIEKFNDEDAFNAYTEGMEDDDQTILRYYGTKSDEDEEPEDNESNSASIWATFFYVFSSLLLVIVLVAAIVALVIKKHPIKVNKKEQNDHDRNNDGSISTSENKEGIVDVDKESKKQSKTTVDDSDEGFV